MSRRQKDGGFTLIELMIVIAVIGILAIVLVPKVGAFKTQAKTAGLETNLMTVQGYVESRINYWAAKSSITDQVIEDEIVNALVEVKSPYDQSIAGVATSPGKGVVVVDATVTNGKLEKVTLTAYVDENTQYRDVTITP